MIRSRVRIRVRVKSALDLVVQVCTFRPPRLEESDETKKSAEKPRCFFFALFTRIPWK